MADRRRSCIWSYFSSPNSHDAVCVLCCRTIKSCGNTTNLMKHLRLHHGTEYEEFLTRRAEEANTKSSGTKRRNKMKQSPSVALLLESIQDAAINVALEEAQGQDQDGNPIPVPVVSTSVSLVETSPPKVKKKMKVENKHRQPTKDIEQMSACVLSPITNIRDEDELFLLSLLPSLKRLTIKKKMEVQMKFQQVLYSAEFED